MAREFQLGEWTVRPEANTLSRGGEERRLTPRVMDLLVYFARNPGEVLAADRIIGAVWPEQFVGDHALLSAVSSLRKALDDQPKRPRFVETIAKRGYRFVGTSSMQRHSIAVLPLRSVEATGGHDDYFADGMTEALIAALGRARGVGVISRQSVMALRGSHQPMREIAAQLGVDLVVEGSALLAGEQVRVTVQLVDAERDLQLWSESYEGDLEDVLGLQSRIAAEILREISERLGVTTTEDAPATARTVDPRAMVAYLRGRFHYWKFAPEHLEKALEYFREAVRIDPDFASAHAGLGDTWGALAYWGPLPASEVADKTLAAARRAVELDASDCEAHVVLGAHHLHVRRDWKTAEAELLEAISLNPSSADARSRYALLLAALRRPEIVGQLDEAYRLDPLNPAVLLIRAMWHGTRAEYELARTVLALLLEIEPRHPPGLVVRADLHWLQETEQALEAECDACAGDPDLQAVLRPTAARVEMAEARGAMARGAALLVERGRERHVQPQQIARLLTHAGHHDEALGWLERAVADENFLQVEMLRLSPSWNELRRHPRFLALEERLGLPS